MLVDALCNRLPGVELRLQLENDRADTGSPRDRRHVLYRDQAFDNPVAAIIFVDGFHGEQWEAGLQRRLQSRERDGAVRHDVDHVSASHFVDQRHFRIAGGLRSNEAVDVRRRACFCRQVTLDEQVEAVAKIFRHRAFRRHGHGEANRERSDDCRADKRAEGYGS